jgi:hypothetical protein
MVKSLSPSAMKCLRLMTKRKRFRRLSAPRGHAEEFDFDGIKYRDALLAWNDAQAQGRRAGRRRAPGAGSRQASLECEAESYNTAKAALRVDDFDGAEHVVRETMSQTQQGVILQRCRQARAGGLRAGPQPGQGEGTGGIKDPVKFAFAVSRSWRPS